MRPGPLALAGLLVAVTQPLAAARIMISGADFHSFDTDGFTFSPTWAAALGDNSSAGCMVAPLNLRHGSVLRSMRVRYVDDQIPEEFSLDFRRKGIANLVSSTSESYIDTLGASPSVQDVLATSFLHAVVDNAFIYYLSTDFDCLEGLNERIELVTIEIDIPIFADGFESGDFDDWGQTPSKLRTAWLSGASFRGSLSNLDWDWDFDPALGTFSQPNALDLPIPCGIAPLELPHGSTVTGLLANLYDIRSDRNLAIEIRRSPIATTAAATAMASAATNGSTGWELESDFTISNAVIDNDSYWYYVTSCVVGGNTLGSGQLLTQAIQVLYTLP